MLVCVKSVTLNHMFVFVRLKKTYQTELKLFFSHQDEAQESQRGRCPSDDSLPSQSELP